MSRYLNPDGTINFEFVRDMRLGLIPGPKKEAENEVLIAYFYGGEAGVARHLAKTGEIQVEVEETGEAAAYRSHLGERYRSSGVPRRLLRL